MWLIESRGKLQTVLTANNDNNRQLYAIESISCADTNYATGSWLK